MVMRTGKCHANVLRTYPHNQAIRSRINSLNAQFPDKEIRILDVCCGQGQMLRDLSHRFDEQKIHYTGIDFNNSNMAELQKYVWEEGLKDRVELRPGSALSEIEVLSPEKYDIVVFVNGLHEQRMLEVPRLLYEMIRVVTCPGSIFVFDLHRLAYGEQELGSTPIRFEQLKNFLKSLKRKGRRFALAEPHRSSNGDILAWSFELVIAKPEDRESALNTLAENEYRKAISLLRGTLENQRIRINTDIISLADEWNRYFDSSQTEEMKLMEKKLDVECTRLLGLHG